MLTAGFSFSTKRRIARVSGWENLPKSRFRSTPRALVRRCAARPSGFAVSTIQRSTPVTRSRCSARVTRRPAGSSPWIEPTTSALRGLDGSPRSTALIGRSSTEWPRTTAASAAAALGRLRRTVEHEDLERTIRVEHDLAVVREDLALGDVLDRRGDGLGHGLLEAQPVLADEALLAGRHQGLLVLREAALEHGEDVVVVDVRLRLDRALAVQLLLDADQRVGDRQAEVAGGVVGASSLFGHARVERCLGRFAGFGGVVVRH